MSAAAKRAPIRYAAKASLGRKRVGVMAAAINKIIKRDGGVSRQALLEDARAKSSPIHDYFEWNDRKASEKYRLIQAGHFIRTIVIANEETSFKGHPVRAYLDPAPPTKAEGATAGPAVFLATSQVFGDAGMAQQVADNALRELMGYYRRYGHYCHLAGFKESLGEVTAAIGRVVKQAERRNAAARE